MYISDHKLLVINPFNLACIMYVCTMKPNNNNNNTIMVCNGVAIYIVIYVIYSYMFDLCIVSYFM